MKVFRLPILAACCLLLVLASDAVCGVSDAAVLFLRIAPGARSAGMGEAFVAVSDDASATHWNPAGLGDYPLADSWYQYKLTDDTHLKEVARKAFYKKLSPDYKETILSWKIDGNTISRLVDGEWKRAEIIRISPDLTFVTSLSRMARTDDKEMFKQATRDICALNSRISFQDINDIRMELLGLVTQDTEGGARVNQMMEDMLVLWQDLRLNQVNFGQFKKAIDAAVADSSVTPKELTELEGLEKACDAGARPAMVAVPYSVLLTVWRNWEVPWEESIQKVAVMENDVPSDNYTHYDIWAVTNFGLKRFDGMTWRNGMTSADNESLVPKPGDKITNVIARVLGTTDEAQVNSRLEAVARANNKVARSVLSELVADMENEIPEDYINRDEMLTKLSALDQAWLSCLLDGSRVEELMNDYTGAMADSSLSQTETDRLFFALDKAVREKLPSMLTFPFGAIFDGDLTDLAVYSKVLYVATTKGLYQFNGRAWSKFSTGVPDEAVYCVEVVKRDQPWIGINAGAKHYAQGRWTSYSLRSGAESLPIKSIHVKGERTVWAASEKDLFLFDGTNWSDEYTYTTTVSDSARSIFTHFYGDLDETTIDKQVAAFEATHADFVSSPTVGVNVDIPFAPLFEGNINCLSMDNDNNLWVGTDLGVKRFDGNAWHNYGYKAIKVERKMSVEDLAKEYLKTADPDKIAGFVSLIQRKNTIPEGDLQEGRVIYVYANPAGSPINSLFSHGGRTYVGSLYGTFSYSGGSWERYYHDDLQRINTKDIEGAAGEMWFATTDKVVVFAHAKREFSFTHSKWLPELASDLYYEFFTYVQPVGGLGTVGANITFLSFGEIARTNEYNPEILETFSSFDGAFTLSYGIRASRNVSLGMSAKIIYSKLADQGAGNELGKGSGTSFAVDGGLIYHMSDRFTLGAALTNLGPDMSYIDAAQSDPLPRNVAVGISYKLLNTPYNRLTVVAEVNKLIATLTDNFTTELKESILNFGAEYWYGSLLALRGGYYIDSQGESTYPTVGLGLQLKEKYRIDFAYIPTSQQYVMGNTLRTSLTVRM